MFLWRWKQCALARWRSSKLTLKSIHACWTIIFKQIACNIWKKSKRFERKLHLANFIQLNWFLSIHMSKNVEIDWYRFNCTSEDNVAVVTILSIALIIRQCLFLVLQCKQVQRLLKHQWHWFKKRKSQDYKTSWQNDVKTIQLQQWH